MISHQQPFVTGSWAPAWAYHSLSHLITVSSCGPGQFDPEETLDTKRSAVTVVFQLPNGSTKDRVHGAHRLHRVLQFGFASNLALLAPQGHRFHDATVGHRLHQVCDHIDAGPDWNEGRGDAAGPFVYVTQIFLQGMILSEMFHDTGNW